MSSVPNETRTSEASTEQDSVPSVDELLVILQASPEAKAKIDALRDKLYGHVKRVIDGNALFGIEQMLWGLIDQTGIYDEEAALAEAMLAEALGSIAYDPHRNVRDEPYGITDEEIVAAEYDATCELCQHDLAESKRRRAGHSDRFEDHADKELLAMHAEAAKRWRKDHAEALRRFGLGPTGHASNGRAAQNGRAS